MSARPLRARWLASASLALVAFAAVSCVRTTSAGSSATATEPRTAPLAPLPLLTVEELALDERVDASEPLPDAPPEPALSSSTEPQAAAIAADVARSAGCYTSSEFDRHGHLPPSDCASLFAALERGGDAASFAIGGYLAENAERLHQDVVTRLSLVLASHPRLGVSFLVRALHLLAQRDETLAQNGGLLRTSPNEFLVRSRLVSMFEFVQQHSQFWFLLF